MSRTRIRRAALITFLLLAAVYLPAFLMGRGGRGFFSPDTLQAKTQSELRFPFCDVSVFRGPFRYHTYELVDFLVAEEYWVPREVGEPKWVFTFHWNVRWHGGEAPFYKGLFCFGRERAWIRWSKEHPGIARDFWPRVLNLLRSATSDRENQLNELLAMMRPPPGLQDEEAYRFIVDRVLGAEKQEGGSGPMPMR